MELKGEAVHKPWLRYWRNSLADASSHCGQMTEEDFGKLSGVSSSAFSEGYLSTPKDQEILQALFEKESDSVQVVKVVVRPVAYRAVLEHGKKRDGFLPDIMTPLVCGLWVGRDGRFVPAEPCVIPRDLLSPLIEDSFTLSSVEDFDRFLTEKKQAIYSENEATALLNDASKLEEIEAIWKSYYELSRQLFDPQCLDERLNTLFLKAKADEMSMIKVDGAFGGASNIIKLYDWLSNQNKPLSLLDNYTTLNVEHRQPCVEPEDTVLLRLGHANSEHSLALAQRDALAQTLVMNEGETLAVNGPPGTGKTTFVLSVVASLWVKAALDETEPPLIIAASTNNQAVTNILDAFANGFEVGDDLLSQRWLPDISSYGGYFVAKSKEKEASNTYQTPAFYRNMETPEQFKQAESMFLSKARTFFEDDSLKSVERVKQTLHQQLKSVSAQLEGVLHGWRQWQETLAHWRITVSDDPPELVLLKKQAVLQGLKDAYGVIDSDAKKWRRFQTEESVWLSLFSFIPPVAHKRQLKAEVFIEENLSDQAQILLNQVGGLNVQSAKQLFQAWLAEQGESIQREERQLTALQDLWRKIQQQQTMFLEVYSLALGFTVVEPPNAFDVLDQSLDTSLRFNLFQWAARYWEARWLEDCVKQREDLAEQARTGREKTGLSKVRPRWLRRMKLTPCVVSTLHALPSHMKHQEFESEGVYRDAYLTEAIDLLIIDEAGQVSPDVAGASVALAKRVLAIGDVKQIPPVVGLSKMVDVGNLSQQGLLQSLDQYDVFRQGGRVVLDGSVMKIAQQASRVHYLPQAEAGMFLREHRRCLNEIISFSNDLCYQGLLQPMRAHPAKDPTLPPFAYVHVDGRVESPPSGSRVNRLEAATIAEWLFSQKERLEAVHDQKLENIVGVVTPFKAQAELIREACEKVGISVGKGDGCMTVGTVHALQGAERTVVIFSAVYSRHDDGGFIDRDPSLLNVAVSRAKDSFLVFGDMEVIEDAVVGTPRHVLSKYLFERESNELLFVSKEARLDLLAYCPTPRVINDAQEHDACIIDLLSTARQKIAIVSPWFNLSRLDETGILLGMRQAVHRGVGVELYVDDRFNRQVNNQWSSTKADSFESDCVKLAEDGVCVHVVSQVHSKLVMVDDAVLCVGSFNWASAVRDQNKVFCNMETSMVYSGRLSDEINFQLHRLTEKTIRSYP